MRLEPTHFWAPVSSGGCRPRFRGWRLSAPRLQFAFGAISFCGGRVSVMMIGEGR